jgi:hypothetical protein
MRTWRKLGLLTLAYIFALALIAACSSHHDPAPGPGCDGGHDGGTQAPEAAPDATSCEGGGDDSSIILPPPSQDAGYSLFPCTTGNDIPYNGGPVMAGSLGVYVIWYGSWAEPRKALIRQFLDGLNGSPWMAIDTTYCDVNGNVVSGMVDRRGEIDVGWELGDGGDAGLIWEDSSQAVQAIVSNAIAQERFPADPGASFMVFVSGEQLSWDGPCTQWCGWHDHYKTGSNDVKIAVIWDPTPCPEACTAFVNGPASDAGISPNGDLAADGIVSVVAHELAETASDPDINAWIGFQENADTCAWTFGATYQTEAGAPANMRLNGRDWLVQQNLVNADGGYCALSWP